jgi:hypothetical protein
MVFYMFFVQFNDFLGQVSLPVLAEGVARAVSITSDQLKLAQGVWAAFRHSTPYRLAEFLACDSSALPCLGSAIHRICQEFPDPTSGVGRTERQILACLAEGPSSLLDVFRKNQAAEEAVYLGDSGFMLVLQRLTQGARPLIDLPLGEAFVIPANLNHPNALDAQAIQLSSAGHAVLRSEHDWLKDMSAPYWIGGCRIEGVSAPRWDQATEGFV